VRALPYIGVVFLWALTVAGVVFVVDQSLGFGDVLIEGTRTPIPGERTVDLEGRKYNLFFEARAIARPERVGDELSDLEASPLQIRIREQGSDRLLQLNAYSTDFTMSGDRDATAFATVRVPHDGRYRISVASSDDLPYSQPGVALGEPIGGRVLTVVVGGILAAAAFIGGLFLLIVTLILHSRRRA
jgi:hypothetical protein